MRRGRRGGVRWTWLRMNRCKRSSKPPHARLPPFLRMHEHVAMAHQFRKHYSLEEARALLPEIREWFGRLSALRQQLRGDDEQLQSRLEAGADCGGEIVNRWVRTVASIKEILSEFVRREIQ